MLGLRLRLRSAVVAGRTVAPSHTSVGVAAVAAARCARLFTGGRQPPAGAPGAGAPGAGAPGRPGPWLLSALALLRRGLGPRPWPALAPALARVAAPAAGGPTALAWGATRGKQTKRQAYSKPARASPCAQRMPNKAHIGLKALPAEYVDAGRMICKQRKYIAKNPLVTRNRHFKLYPGVNVNVMKSTSLQASVSGRVKITHCVIRDLMIMNVLPEPREELMREDLYRYRTEHIQSMEENKYLCYLRTKALHVFGKDEGWVNQPAGPKPLKVRISHRQDSWNNHSVQDHLEVEPFAFPLPRHLLARHIQKVRRKHAGVPDEENDPEFEVRDKRFSKFRGQMAQR